MSDDIKPDDENMGDNKIELPGGGTVEVVSGGGTLPEGAEAVATGVFDPATGKLSMTAGPGQDISNHPVLGKLAELIQQSANTHKKPQALEPEEAIEIFLGNMWTPQLGDVVVLRDEFDHTQPVILKNTEYIITQLIDPPLHHGEPQDPDWGKRHDCAVAVKISHGDHFHYHEVMVDSRNLKKTGSIKEMMDGEPDGFG